jgi:phosphatidylglycerophosphate synthase
VADKLIVVAALLALLYLNRVDVIVALIIVASEIAISATARVDGESGAERPARGGLIAS